MKYKKFVLSYFVILLIFGLLLVGIFYYLSRIFEHNSFESIVQRQIKHNSIYGTALNENVFAYKLELVKQTKPKVIALGSSRVLQFREEFFTHSFISAGNAMNNENVFAYKLELVKQTKPKVIALGSSRVLQFREEFFTHSFISAGNAMNTLKEGRLFLEEVFKFYKPDIVILGLGVWWFNPFIPNYEKGEYFNITGTNISGAKVRDIVKHIYHRQFFQPQYLLDNHFITNPYSNLDSLGLNAIYNGRGFFKDGSYVYGEIFKDEKTKDANFADTFWRIENSHSQFAYASHIDKERMQDLFNILNLLEKHHIQVVIFIPPLAPSVYQAIQDKPKEYAHIDKERMQDLFNILNLLEKHHIQVVIFIPPLAPSVYQAIQDKPKEYAYIDELFTTLQEYHIPFFNYHNPAVLHNDNCEFLDGFHGGDVFYARILADMAHNNQILKSYVNMPYLTELIRTHKGRVFSKDSVSDLKEQDFLNLGCER